MTRRSAWLWSSVVVALGAAAAVFFVVSGGGGSGVGGGAAETDSAGAHAPAIADAAPDEAPKGAVALADGTSQGDARGAAEHSTLDPSKSVLVRGKLVVLATGAPPKNAVVSATTGKPELDAPRLFARFGGKRGVEKRLWTGEIELAMREEGGFKPENSVKARSDGTFEIRVPKESPRFALDVEADDALLPSSSWLYLGTPAVENGVTLLLEAAGTIEGKLVDADGQTAQHGFLSLQPDWSRTRTDVARVSWGRFTKSDASGRFVFRGVPTGKETVHGIADGCGAAHQEVRVEETSAPTAFELKLPREVVLEGRVVDAEGRGVNGASVRFWPASTWFNGLGYGVAAVGADGRFRAAGLTAGKHRIMVRCDGRIVRDELKSIDVPLPAGAEPLKIVLEEGRALAGRVVGGDGQGIAGARVRVAPWRKEYDYEAMMSPRKQFLQDGMTAADGSFRVSGLGDAPYLVRAEKENVGAAVKSEVAGADEKLELTLRRGTGIEGKARDVASGAPIATFTVTLSPKGDQGFASMDFSERERAFRSDDGAFTLDDLAPGAYEVTVTAEGRAPSKKDVEVKDGELTRGIVFDLEASTRLRGKVIEAATGAPVAGASVRAAIVKKKGNDDEEEAHTTTGADGAFELQVTKTGAMRVKVTHDQFTGAASEAFDAARGATIDVPAIELGRGGALEGVAIGEGEKPMANAQVNANFADDAARGAMPEAWKSAQTDSRGAFKIDGLAPGKWHVSVQPSSVSMDPSDWMAMQRKSIQGTADVVAGQSARVQFAAPLKGGCTVRGRVTRGGIALAKVNVQVMTFAKETGADPSMFGRLMAQTDETGAFAIEHVPPGQGMIHGNWSADGERSYGWGSQNFNIQLVVPDAAEHFVELAVPVGGEIKGRIVRRADGKPVKGASVNASPEQRPQATKTGAASSVSSNPSAQTDGDGRYVLRGVTPGQVRVSAGSSFGWRPDDESESTKLSPQTRKGVEVTEGGTITVDFALEAGTTVVVTVVNAAGEPVNDQSVQLLPASRDAQMDPDAMRWGNTDEEGVARIQGVAPGTYYATASVKSATSVYSEDFEVRVGADSPVRLQAHPGVELRIAAIGPDGAPAKIRSATLLDARNRVAANYFVRKADEATVGATLRAAPGSYKLSVNGEGVRATIDAVVGDKPADISVKLEKIVPEVKKNE